MNNVNYTSSNTTGSVFSEKRSDSNLSQLDKTVVVEYDDKGNLVNRKHIFESDDDQELIEEAISQSRKAIFN